MFKALLIFSIAVLAVPMSLAAAAAGSQEQEYQQVRKIALRDPKVRAAYDEADRRLETKIVQIDPALKSYVTTRRTDVVQLPPATHEKAAPSATHVVAKGDTLSTIAARYGVTVATLKATNQIEDERKLRAGQTLTIPHPQPK